MSCPIFNGDHRYSQTDQWLQMAHPMARRQLANEDEVVFDTFTNMKENNMKEDESSGCAICLEEYKANETRATISACSHRYHATCIKAWLKENDTCPLCRSHVV
ncbi:RING/U-box superfamily protein [Striga asiatica]|uniref:RING/U-box superfamily protein n=1 Tax=Striga asiatica TaxID=4170 RepID=A0A5A7R1A2_STRAF|nr:RING/U-box superfamily protein [Striga asiatica]